MGRGGMPHEYDSGYHTRPPMSSERRDHEQTSKSGKRQRVDDAAPGRPIMRSVRPPVLDSRPVLSLRVVKLDVAYKHPGGGEKHALCYGRHPGASEKAGDVKEEI